MCVRGGDRRPGRAHSQKGMSRMRPAVGSCHLGAGKLCGRGSPPACHLFATLFAHAVASGVVFGVAGMDVNVFVLAFQPVA